jgi:hypothetical protein
MSSLSRREYPTGAPSIILELAVRLFQRGMHNPSSTEGAFKKAGVVGSPSDKFVSGWMLIIIAFTQ